MEERVDLAGDLLVEQVSAAFLDDVEDVRTRAIARRENQAPLSELADGLAGLIGSANLDRRSFELNFENNLLFADAAFAAQVRARQDQRQDQWLALSSPVTPTTVAAYSVPRRLWQNLLAMWSPLL